MSNKRLFLGIKQVLEKTFNQLTDEEKVGYVWFVYNNLEEEENKTALCKIYLGTKKYGEINDKVVSLETLDKIRTKIGLEENLELPDDFIFDSITSSIISIINNLTGINSNVQNIQDDIVEINKKTENIENCEFIVSEALNKTKDLIGLDKYFDLPLNYEYETIIDGIIDKAKKDDVYTKTEIDTKFRGSIHFIGTVDYFRNLEELSPNDGNVYMVRFHDDGTLWNSEFLYNGVSWIELGPIINFGPINDKINDIEHKISLNTQDISLLQSGITTIETNLDDTNNNVELNKQDIVKISKNLTDINNTISEHSQEILDLQSGITILDDNIQNIVEIIDVVESGLSSLDDNIIKTNNEITSIEEDINTINNDIDVLQSGITTIETNLNDTNSKVDLNKQQIDTVKNNINDLYNIKLDTVISINYSELLTKRNNSQLISGQWYRITDYITTVANDSEAQSIEHPFDILVQAIDINTLSEEAKAIKSERDTVGYFSDSDLHAWKIWYSIDNDTTRFAWADDVNGKGVIYHMIDEHNNDLPFDFKNIQFKRYAITAITSTTLTTEALNELINTFVYANNNGKCFATKDAYGNLIPTESNGTKYTIDENTFEWYYVFQGFYSDGDGTSISGTYDMSTHPYKLKDEVIEDMKLNEYGSNTKDWCDNNKIDTAHLEFFGDDEYYIGRQVLNNIVFLNDISYCYYYEKDGYWGYVTSENHSNRFKSECKNNTFGNSFNNNTFGNGFNNNTFGNNLNWNTFGNNCLYNTFGNNCQFNTFGNSFNNNTFGNSFNNNTFGNYVDMNTFGNNVNWNTFGNNVGINTFGNSFNNNTFGNYCWLNTFGNDYIRWCTIFDGVQYINVSVTTGPSSYLQNMQILNGTKGTDSSNKLQITSSYITSNRSFSTTIGRNSSGTLTSKNLMD